MNLEVPFLRVKSLSTPTYWGKTILARLWLQTAPSFLCPKRVTLSKFSFCASGNIWPLIAQQLRCITVKIAR
jgi:hypothetical protein